jgi:hypothetical protein
MKMANPTKQQKIAALTAALAAAVDPLSRVAIQNVLAKLQAQR